MNSGQVRGCVGRRGFISLAGEQRPPTVMNLADRYLNVRACRLPRCTRIGARTSWRRTLSRPPVEPDRRRRNSQQSAYVSGSEERVES